jgi:hypothetical protein
MHPLFSSPTAQLSNSANEYATNATNGITSVNAEHVRLKQDKWRVRYLYYSMKNETRRCGLHLSGDVFGGENFDLI